MNARRPAPTLVHPTPLRSGDYSRLSSVVCRPSVLVVLLTLPALWPLLRQGFFVSDDGLFHVYRVAALADAWSHGVLYPRLFPDFGFGYGQAVLNFYAPLTYVPGALLASLGVNPATAVEITIALGFVLAALAIYGTTRSLWGPVGGVLAAVAYTYFPYHLADAYLRGAVPEFFAFIWPPLILWATTDAFRKERPVGPLLWGALAWTGLIFTHNLTALMMAPVWIAYALLMAAWTRRWRRSDRRGRLAGAGPRPERAAVAAVPGREPLGGDQPRPIRRLQAPPGPARSGGAMAAALPVPRAARRRGRSPAQLADGRLVSACPGVVHLPARPSPARDRRAGRRLRPGADGCLCIHDHAAIVAALGAAGADPGESAIPLALPHADRARLRHVPRRAAVAALGVRRGRHAERSGARAEAAGGAASFDFTPQPTRRSAQDASHFGR